MHHRGAHGAKHHAGEPATAMAAYYHELGRFGLVTRLAGRFIEDDDAAHGHVGVPFLPPGQALGQRSSALDAIADQSTPGKSARSPRQKGRNLPLHNSGYNPIECV